MSDKINNRLEDLQDVLVYDSEQKKIDRPGYFTKVERICINQERGSLLSQINQQNAEEDKRYYICPPVLQSKIRFVIQKVENQNQE